MNHSPARTGKSHFICARENRFTDALTRVTGFIFQLRRGNATFFLAFFTEDRLFHAGNRPITAGFFQ
jgi:hypothetical protein